MKIKKDVVIEGDIIASRLAGQKNHFFCIHLIHFKNGKYAIIRAASGACFDVGHTVRRTASQWFYNHHEIRLLSFEYLEEQESRRQFLECD